MKKNLRFIIALLALLCATPSFANNEYGSPAAQRIREATSQFRQLPIDRDHARHGRRVFEAGLRFAKKHNVPYFVETMRNGQKRLVMNVAGPEQIKAYADFFAPRQRNGVYYMENFFSASATSEPSWSYLRVGGKTWNEYGQNPFNYSVNTGGVRTAFPYSVTKDELDTRMNAIKTTPNAPFSYGGGIMSGTAQNCTDWLTNVVGGVTGITTNSVKHHASSLMDASSWLSPRMTVKTVISATPIADFKNSTLAGPRTW